MHELPLFPVMGVGSYAAPGWFIAFRQKIRDESAGEADIQEALDDATRIAVSDQLDAGVDILTDGELRRQRFVYEMFDRVIGLSRITPGRKIGVPGSSGSSASGASMPISRPSAALLPCSG